MARELIKQEQSEEWSGIEDTQETEIPFWGEDEEESTGDDDPTEEELAAQQAAADAAAQTAGKTPEEIAAEAAAAAAAGKTPEELQAAQQAAQQAAIDAQMAEAKKQWLKDMGFESEEDIKKLKNPAAPETEEQKKLRQDQFDASLQQFAVSKNKMTLAEITSYRQLSAMPARDVVFGNFEAEYRDLNKDRDPEGEEGPVTDDEIADAFESLYHTESVNPGLKKSGERALANRAKELLGETEAKYNSAKEEFEFLNERAAKLPGFVQFVQASLKEAIPEKKTFKVDGREFVVELDGTDFTEIEKKFKDDNVLGRYMDETQRQGLKENIHAEAQRQIAHKYEAKIAEIANKAGYAEGLKAGAVGAKAPFKQQQQQQAAQAGKGLSAADKANIRRSLGKY